MHMLLRVSDGGWMDGWHRPEDPHLSPPNPWHSSPLVLYSTGGTLKSGVSQNSTWSPDWKIGEKGETKNPPKKDFSAWHLICHTSWFWKDSEPKCTESLA